MLKNKLFSFLLFSSLFFWLLDARWMQDSRILNKKTLLNNKTLGIAGSVGLLGFGALAYKKGWGPFKRYPNIQEPVQQDIQELLGNAAQNISLKKNLLEEEQLGVGANAPLNLNIIQEPAQQDIQGLLGLTKQNIFSQKMQSPGQERKPEVSKTVSVPRLDKKQVEKRVQEMKEKKRKDEIADTIREISETQRKLKTLVVDDALLEKFDKKYAPPAGVIQKIEANKKAILDKWQGQSDVLPGFYLKGDDVDRVINAAKVQNCINKYNLTRLGVAKKYVYKINGKRLVFAEEVKPDTTGNQEFDLELAQQLATLVEKTGLSDLRTNLTWSGGKLVCFDTEDASFIHGQFLKHESDPDCKGRYIYKLTEFGDIDPDARKWLKERMNYWLELCKKNDPESIIDRKSTEFDDPEINFRDLRQALEDEQSKKKAPKKISSLIKYELFDKILENVHEQRSLASAK